MFIGIENLSTVDWPMLSKTNVTKVTVEKKYKKCDECEFETNKTSNLKRHMKIHEKITSELVEPLKCSICEKSFEIKKYLTAHKKTHVKETNLNKDKVRQKKKCNVCPFETH